MSLNEYQEHYSSIAQYYYNLDNFDQNGPHWHRTLFFLKHLKTGQKILDCGCSNGGLAKYLTGHIECMLFSFDIAPFFSQNAQTNAPRAICGCFPVEKTPFVNDVFDVVIAGEILEHVLDVNVALKEMLRVCKQNGLILATTPKIPDNNPQHLRFLGKDEWLGTLPGCTVEETEHSWLVFYKKQELV